jgi:lia operon protein LiaF
MNRSTIIIGSILIFLGLFFLLRSLSLIWFSFGDLVRVFFPLALIAAGLWLMVRRKSKIRMHHEYHFSTSSKPSPGSSSATADDPNRVATVQAEEASDKVKGAPSQRTDGKIRFDKMLGDMYIDCEGYNLNNIEISMGLGDLDVKVSGGILANGLNRMIISGFIGDMRIFIPKDFSYFAHCSNFVGDVIIGDKRASGFGNTVEHHTPDYDKADSKLYIAANSFIGDIKIFAV